MINLPAPTFKNYIKNNIAYNNTAGWVTYADAADSRPVDGTGGSPNITWTRSTTDPLSGGASFLLTKDAANRQGEGASWDFPIDILDRGHVMLLKSDYFKYSGTFAAGSDSSDSDLIFYFYDVTNSQLIEPTPFRLFSESGSLFGTIQPPSNCEVLRLIIHQATTSASAYEMQFDNFSLSREPMITASIASDTKSYVPTGNFVTNTTYSGEDRRVGDCLEGEATIQFSGVPDSTSFSLTIRSGLLIDTNKISDGTGTRAIVGYATAGDTGVGNHLGVVIVTSSTTLQVVGDDGAGTWSDTVPIAFNTGDFISVNFKVPIVGWASQTQASDQSQNRVIAARITGLNSVTSTTTGGVIKYFDTQSDTSGSYDSSTGLFTAPEAGHYRVTNGMNNSSAASAGDYTYLGRNGNAEVARLCVASLLNGSYSGSSSVYCNAGDTLGIYSSANSLTLADGLSYAYVNFEKIQGPISTLPTETIACRYTGSPATGTLTTAFNKTTFGTKVFDTHSAYVAGTFTVPISGKYHISAITRVTGTYAANDAHITAIFKNGLIVQQTIERAFTAQSDASSNVVGLIDCVSGDVIEIHAYNGSTGPAYASGAPEDSNVNIHRIGN